MLLSIVIVNYNGRRFLADCLDSIKTHVSCSHEVIIVDNASSDGSCELLRTQYPWVRLARSSVNTGFAKGNNIGVAVATGQYILLLNNDTKLLTDVAPALSILENEEEVGVVGAMMFGRDNGYRHSCGYFPSPMRLIRISSLYRKNGPFRFGEFGENLPPYYPVDWVEGSFLLSRRELWRKLGGLDEACFMYGEDVDFCRRIRDAGYLSVYCRHVRYVHYVGYSHGRLPMIVKGFMRFHRRHSGVGTRIAVGVILGAKLVTTYLSNMLLFLAKGSSSNREMMDVSRRAFAHLFEEH